jgi:hypothetical protein
MKQIIDGAKTAGIEVIDYGAKYIWFDHPTPNSLQRLADAMVSCLDKAYTSKETLTDNRDGHDFILWYVRIGDHYDYCFGSKPPVGTLGGTGPHQNYSSIGFVCRPNESALPSNMDLRNSDE